MKQINADVIIVGGGLAGMSLALQLINQGNKFNFVIVEKNKFPVPDTTAKVGESTVEIGSHYFTHTLKLQEHFKQHHLRKHGLRCFFGHASEDCSEYDELGVSELFGIPTYQLERGVLENHIYQLLIDHGVTFLDGSTTETIDVNDGAHIVKVTRGGETIQCEGKWLVDAAGRQALLKNKLDLHANNDHKGNAIFFRVNEQIIIDEWSNNDKWHDKVKDPGKRWLSTNHLMGPGYWVWIIPLGSGATSFGIVMDDQAFEESDISSYEDTLAWLQKHQPKCAKALENTTLLDFVVMRDFSYGCKQMFSANRWAITGEAGAFPDPFYSPGSDFIAISNTFIAALIEKDLNGENIQLLSILYQKFYSSFFENTMTLYRNQYGGFGDRKMMSIKLVWDYTYYWGVLTLLFFTNCMTDVEKMRELNPMLMRAKTLNEKMQMLMNKRAQKRLVLPTKGLFMDQFIVPCLKQLNETLKADQINVVEALSENLAIMEKIVPYFEDMLADNPSLQLQEGEEQILGQYRQSVLA